MTYTPGVRGADGSAEFLVVTARRERGRRVRSGVRRGQGLRRPRRSRDASAWSICSSVPRTCPTGDWLVVHLRPDYTSIVIMRGGDVIFFRNRPEGDEASIADLVHQTAMYYQDRLSGQRFSRVVPRRQRPRSRGRRDGAAQPRRAAWRVGRADRSDAGGRAHGSNLGDAGPDGRPRAARGHDAAHAPGGGGA